MKSISGWEISEKTRAVVYLCNFNFKTNTISVFREVHFESAFDALQFYANTPNPASQIARGKTYEELCIELTQLHKNMKDKNWLNGLSKCL